MSLYDHNDPRVKKIVVDYARSKGHEDDSDTLNRDIDDLFLERHDSSYRGPEVWIVNLSGEIDYVMIYGITVEDIVNNAILDLLTKE